MKGSPPQVTPPYHRHLQCQAGRSASPSEIERYAGRATQARQVPTKESEDTDKAGGALWVNYNNPGFGGWGGGIITHKTTTHVQKPKKYSRTIHNIK